MGWLLLLQIFGHKLMMALQKKSGDHAVGGISPLETLQTLYVKIHPADVEIFHWKREKFELLVAPDKKSGDQQSLQV